MVKKKKSPKAKKVDTRFLQGWRPSPLKGSFMALSIVGFLTSYYLIYEQFRSIDYGVSLMLVFILMFIASLISMTKAPAVERG